MESDILMPDEFCKETSMQEGKLPLWLATERSHMQVVKELLQELGAEQLSYHNHVSSPTRENVFYCN